MKKLFFSLFIISALSSSATNSRQGWLNEVNAEWKNNADGQLLAKSFHTDDNLNFTDWITTHLTLVEKTLKQRPVDHLNLKQKENRRKLLNVLNEYSHEGVYPVNDYLHYKNPVFIDRTGTHCAVGYLMQQSGAEELASIIDSENKFVFVKEIKISGVAEWANENGFTIDELAWIQPGYPPQFDTDNMEGGLNGPVKALATDPSTQLIYAGGSFTASVKGNPCNGVAVYISGIAGWDWIGLGSGVNGSVNALLIHNNMLYVGGEFTMAGSTTVSNIAVFDLINQQWQAMGSLDSTVNALAVFNNEIYAGGKFTGFVSKWAGSQWQDVAQGYLYGEEVRTLEAWGSNLYIGGNFELATGALRKHVAAYDGVIITSSGMGTVTPVNDFEVFRDTIYAACDVAIGNDTCAIARFVNYDWEIILKPYNAGTDNFQGVSINYFLEAGNKLFCAGNFSCSSGLFYGNNLMEFHYDAAGQTMCSPLIIVDNIIRTMVWTANSIVFGGDFENAMTDTLNYVGQLLNVISSVDNPAGNLVNTLSIYPNPASEKIQVLIRNSTSKEFLVKIVDQTGREIFREANVAEKFTLDLSGILSGGVYLLQATDEKGAVAGTGRIIVSQ